MIIIHDDMSYLEYILQIVRKKGVKIVEVPS